MPWDFGAGVAAAAGAGAGLIGDSIKRERNLEDATNLEALKSKVEQEKQARIADIVRGVSRTKDVPISGPTEDGSSLGTMQQPKAEHEYSREVGDALTQKGLITDAGKFYDRADRHEDKTERRDTAAAAQKSADEKWKTTEARQDKVWEETVRHNKALEAKAGAERISPAARAQLEMASTYVSSAHRAEAEAAKAFDAVRKNVAADPAQLAAAESEYKLSKAATASALKQYDQFGAAHFGDKWKKVETAAAPAAGGAPQDVRVGGKVIGQATTRAEADALVAAHKAGKKPAAAAPTQKPAFTGVTANLLQPEYGKNGMIQTRETL
jgi:hypothetical protein